MIKTRMIENGYYACDKRLDTKINDFIEENNIKVIDIKFAPTGRDNIATALVIYEEEEND